MGGGGGRDPLCEEEVLGLNQSWEHLERLEKAREAGQGRQAWGEMSEDFPEGKLS